MMAIVFWITFSAVIGLLGLVTYLCRELEQETNENIRLHERLDRMTARQQELDRRIQLIGAQRSMREISNNN
jgi:hypothetical protein